MPCKQKAALLSAYMKASEFYAFSVGQIQCIRPTASRDEYEQAKLLSEDARRECDIVRDELEQHTVTHGC